MRFLAALLFALLLFVIPGELGLMALAAVLATVATLPYQLWLGLLNLGIFLLILVGLHFSRKVWMDFELYRGVRRGFILEFLDVSTARWINLAGLVVVSIGAAAVILHGIMPVPFFYLFAAVVIGLVDLSGKDQLVTWEPEPLPPRIEPVPIPVPPTPDSDTKEVRLAWNFHPDGPDSPSIACEKLCLVSGNEYQIYRKKGRYPYRPLTEYSRYIRDGIGVNVKDLAYFFRQQTQSRHLSPVQEVENVVSMVRSIRYEFDQVTRNMPDWANFPVETVYDEQGDCEDHAILAAAILHVLGHKVGLIWLEFSDNAHLALGYVTEQLHGPFTVSHEGTRYAYVETVPASPDERIGHISQQFLSELKRAEVVVIT